MTNTQSYMRVPILKMIQLVDDVKNTPSSSRLCILLSFLVVRKEQMRRGIHREV